MNNYNSQQKYRTCEEYILDEYRSYKSSYESLKQEYDRAIQVRDAYQEQSTKLRNEIMQLAVIENEELISLVFMQDEKEQFPEIMKLIQLGKIKKGETEK